MTFFSSPHSSGRALSAVDPEYRRRKIGYTLKHLQYREVPDEKFYWEDTTQLSNYPVMRNNIADANTLRTIALIYYRVPDANTACCAVRAAEGEP